MTSQYSSVISKDIISGTCTHRASKTDVVVVSINDIIRLKLVNRANPVIEECWVHTLLQ